MPHTPRLHTIKSQLDHTIAPNHNIELLNYELITTKRSIGRPTRAKAWPAMARLRLAMARLRTMRQSDRHHSSAVEEPLSVKTVDHSTLHATQAQCLQ